MAHAKASDSIVVFGTSDDVTSCEHCGRTNLKATVAISIDGGEIVYFGRDCAATALKVGKASIRKALREVEAIKADEASRERRERQSAESAKWDAFCAPFGGIREAIEHHGGFSAARAAFRAE